MIKSKASQLVAVALAAGMLIGAAAERAISRLDVREMSAAEKNKQVRKDLLSILTPSTSLYRSKQPSLDGDVWLHTKPSAAQYRSLCQRDTLLLYYASIEKAGRPEERSALPYKLASKRSYRFVSAPKPEYVTAANVDDHDRSPFARECRSVGMKPGDDEWSGWFAAPSPEMAMDGGFAMLAMQEWAKRPASEFANCKAGTNPRWCKAEVEFSLNLDMIGGVESCAADKQDTICLQLGDYGHQFTIRARQTNKPMQAGDIISVDYEIFIVAV